VITFWVNRDGLFGIQNYRSHRGRAIAERVEPRCYDGLFENSLRFDGGAQIFAGLDQATRAQRELAARVWDAHAAAAPHLPRLNDPRRVLLRFELLHRMAEVGLNAFRVYRTDQVDEIERFPVFVRHIHRHTGPSTRLVRGHDDLRRVLKALRIRGRRLREHMIVEFCDVSDSVGLFRKYAAFRVGRHIIPSHVFASRSWALKSSDNAPTEASIHEELQFQRENPHADWLTRVFDLAGIEYGRIDYGVLDGMPQVWEINLNPTIGRAEGQSRQTGLAPPLKALRDGGREAFHARLRTAILELDSHAQGGELEAHVDARLLLDLQRQARQVERRKKIDDWLSWLYERSILSRTVKRLYARLPAY
jgi:hypothetical protein